MRLPFAIALLCAAGLTAWLLSPRPASEERSAPPQPPAAVTPELLAAEVEAVRGLRFVRPLQFVRVTPAALEEKVRAAMRAAVPPREGALRVRAALALALIRPGLEFDAADCLAGAVLEVPAAYYEPATATMYVSDACSQDTRPDLIMRLVYHLARALVQQQPGLVPPAANDNDDALLTRLALLDADASLTARSHAARHAGRAAAGITVPEVASYHAMPPFLLHVMAFPGSVPGTFHAALRRRLVHPDTNELLNQLLQRPPRTTAELLHPELWPATPAAAPDFAQDRLPPLPLLTENCLGECGVRTLFKTQLTSTEADTAAAGLLTDRCRLYAGDGPGRDHLLWKTRWATASDAAEFLRALAATHLGNAGVAVLPDHFPSPGSFRAQTPLLTLLAATDAEHGVIFVASPDATIAEKLLAAP